MLERKDTITNEVGNHLRSF